MLLLKVLRLFVVLAAPTCALWEYNINQDSFYFKLWPEWKISALEYWQVSTWLA